MAGGAARRRREAEAAQGTLSEDLLFGRHDCSSKRGDRAELSAFVERKAIVVSAKQLRKARRRLQEDENVTGDVWCDALVQALDALDAQCQAVVSTTAVQLLKAEDSAARPSVRQRTRARPRANPNPVPAHELRAEAGPLRSNRRAPAALRHILMRRRSNIQSRGCGRSLGPPRVPRPRNQTLAGTILCRRHRTGAPSQHAVGTSWVMAMELRTAFSMAARARRSPMRRRCMRLPQERHRQMQTTCNTMYACDRPGDRRQWSGDAQNSPLGHGDSALHHAGGECDAQLALSNASLGLL